MVMMVMAVIAMLMLLLPVVSLMAVVVIAPHKNNHTYITQQWCNNGIRAVDGCRVCTKLLARFSLLSFC